MAFEVLGIFNTPVRRPMLFGGLALKSEQGAWVVQWSSIPPASDSFGPPTFTTTTFSFPECLVPILTLAFGITGVGAEVPSVHLAQNDVNFSRYANLKIMR